MGPKKQKGKMPVDGVDTTSMSREQLEAFCIRLREELDREREERNFFQVERDKLRTFWEVTRQQLEECRAQLRNQDRAIDELEEKHQAEIKVYKQKVKHLLYEHQNNLSELKVESMVSLKQAQDDYAAMEQQLLKDKKELKEQIHSMELAHLEEVKQLKMEHSGEMSKIREQLESDAAELERKYEARLQSQADEQAVREQMEQTELETRKNQHIVDLTKQHEIAFQEMKNYYNDITLNNLALISSLKEQMEELKSNHDRMEKQLNSVQSENKRLAEPLKLAQNELGLLRRQLATYEQDKVTLANTKQRLVLVTKELEDLRWENDVLELRFEKVEKERDRLHAEFVGAVLDVQQKTGLKGALLEKRMSSMRSGVSERSKSDSSLIEAGRDSGNEVRVFNVFHSGGQENCPDAATRGRRIVDKPRRSLSRLGDISVDAACCGQKSAAQPDRPATAPQQTFSNTASESKRLRSGNHLAVRPGFVCKANVCRRKHAPVRISDDEAVGSRPKSAAPSSFSRCRAQRPVQMTEVNSRTRWTEAMKFFSPGSDVPVNSRPDLPPPLSQKLSDDFKTNEKWSILVRQLENMRRSARGFVSDRSVPPNADPVSNYLYPLPEHGENAVLKQPTKRRSLIPQDAVSNGDMNAIRKYPSNMNPCERPDEYYSDFPCGRHCPCGHVCDGTSTESYRLADTNPMSWTFNYLSTNCMRRRYFPQILDYVRTNLSPIRSQERQSETSLHETTECSANHSSSRTQDSKKRCSTSSASSERNNYLADLQPEEFRKDTGEAARHSQVGYFTDGPPKSTTPSKWKRPRPVSATRSDGRDVVFSQQKMRKSFCWHAPNAGSSTSPKSLTCREFFRLSPCPKLPWHQGIKSRYMQHYTSQGEKQICSSGRKDKFSSSQSSSRKTDLKIETSFSKIQQSTHTDERGSCSLPTGRGITKVNLRGQWRLASTEGESEAYYSQVVHSSFLSSYTSSEHDRNCASIITTPKIDDSPKVLKIPQPLVEKIMFRQSSVCSPSLDNISLLSSQTDLTHNSTIRIDTNFSRKRYEDVSEGDDSKNFQKDDENYSWNRPALHQVYRCGTSNTRCRSVLAKSDDFPSRLGDDSRATGPREGSSKDKGSQFLVSPIRHLSITPEAGRDSEELEFVVEACSRGVNVSDIANNHESRVEILEITSLTDDEKRLSEPQASANSNEIAQSGPTTEKTNRDRNNKPSTSLEVHLTNAESCAQSGSSVRPWLEVNVSNDNQMICNGPSDNTHESPPSVLRMDSSEYGRNGLKRRLKPLCIKKMRLKLMLVCCHLLRLQASHERSVDQTPQTKTADIVFYSHHCASGVIEAVAEPEREAVARVADGTCLLATKETSEESNICSAPSLSKGQAWTPEQPCKEDEKDPSTPQSTFIDVGSVSSDAGEGNVPPQVILSQTTVKEEDMTCHTSLSNRGANATPYSDHQRTPSLLVSSQPRKKEDGVENLVRLQSTDVSMDQGGALPSSIDKDVPRQQSKEEMDDTSCVPPLSVDELVFASLDCMGRTVRPKRTEGETDDSRCPAHQSSSDQSSKLSVVANREEHWQKISSKIFPSRTVPFQYLTTVHQSSTSVCREESSSLSQPYSRHLRSDDRGVDLVPIVTAQSSLIDKLPFSERRVVSSSNEEMDDDIPSQTSACHDSSFSCSPEGSPPSQRSEDAPESGDCGECMSPQDSMSSGLIAERNTTTELVKVETRDSDTLQDTGGAINYADAICSAMTVKTSLPSQQFKEEARVKATMACAFAGRCLRHDYLCYYYEQCVPARVVGGRVRSTDLVSHTYQGNAVFNCHSRPGVPKEVLKKIHSTPPRHTPSQATCSGNQFVSVEQFDEQMRYLNPHVLSNELFTPTDRDRDAYVQNLRRKELIERTRMLYQGDQTTHQNYTPATYTQQNVPSQYQQLVDRSVHHPPVAGYGKCLPSYFSEQEVLLQSGTEFLPSDQQNVHQQRPLHQAEFLYSDQQKACQQTFLQQGAEFLYSDQQTAYQQTPVQQGAEFVRSGQQTAYQQTPLQQGAEFVRSGQQTAYQQTPVQQGAEFVRSGQQTAYQQTPLQQGAEFVRSGQQIAYQQTPLHQGTKFLSSDQQNAYQTPLQHGAEFLCSGQQNAYQQTPLQQGAEFVCSVQQTAYQQTPVQQGAEFVCSGQQNAYQQTPLQQGAQFVCSDKQTAYQQTPLQQGAEFVCSGQQNAYQDPSYYAPHFQSTNGMDMQFGVGTMDTAECIDGYSTDPYYDPYKSGEKAPMVESMDSANVESVQHDHSVAEFATKSETLAEPCEKYDDDSVAESSATSGTLAEPREKQDDYSVAESATKSETLAEPREKHDDHSVAESTTKSETLVEPCEKHEDSVSESSTTSVTLAETREKQDDYSVAESATKSETLAEPREKLDDHSVAKSATKSVTLAEPREKQDDHSVAESTTKSETLAEPREKLDDHSVAKSTTKSEILAEPREKANAFESSVCLGGSRLSESSRSSPIMLRVVAEEPNQDVKRIKSVCVGSATSASVSFCPSIQSEHIEEACPAELSQSQDEEPRSVNLSVSIDARQEPLCITDLPRRVEKSILKKVFSSADRLESEHNQCKNSLDERSDTYSALCPSGSASPMSDRKVPNPIYVCPLAVPPGTIPADHHKKYVYTSYPIKTYTLSNKLKCVPKQRNLIVFYEVSKLKKSERAGSTLKKSKQDFMQCVSKPTERDPYFLPSVSSVPAAYSLTASPPSLVEKASDTKSSETRSKHSQSSQSERVASENSVAGGRSVRRVRKAEPPCESDVQSPCYKAQIPVTISASKFRQRVKRVLDQDQIRLSSDALKEGDSSCAMEASRRHRGGCRECVKKGRHCSCGLAKHLHVLPLCQRQQASDEVASVDAKGSERVVVYYKISQVKEEDNRSLPYADAFLLKKNVTLCKSKETDSCDLLSESYHGTRPARGTPFRRKAVHSADQTRRVIPSIVKESLSAALDAQASHTSRGLGEQLPSEITLPQVDVTPMVSDDELSTLEDSRLPQSDENIMRIAEPARSILRKSGRSPTRMGRIEVASTARPTRVTFQEKDKKEDRTRFLPNLSPRWRGLSGVKRDRELKPFRK